MHTNTTLHVHGLNKPLALERTDVGGSVWFDLNFPSIELTFFASHDPQLRDYLSRLSTAIASVPWEAPKNDAD